MLLQFAVNARRTPDGIRATHLLDRADVDGDRRSTETGLSGTPAPMPSEQCEQHPEEPVGSAEPKPSRRGLLKNGELVAEGQDLGLEFGASAEAGPRFPPAASDHAVASPALRQTFPAP